MISRKAVLRTVVVLSALAVLSFVVLVSVMAAGAMATGRRSSRALDQILSSAPTDAELVKKNAQLRKKLDALAPKAPYLVIDTALNRLQLRKGGQVLRDAVVSCGSGVVLKEPSGKRTWVFDTPRGEFQVRSKAKDPVWIKPDWAFIEEGEAPPSKYSERVEEGMLGDYAMGFGNGYFIHGTLYKRLLGRNVTHGCVRVGDQDLDYLFKAVPLGTRIFIF